MSTVTVDPSRPAGASVPRASPSSLPSTRKVLLVTGAFLALSLPVFAGSLLGLSALMPGCGAAGASPLSGCALAGIELNTLYALFTPAVLLALFTVPAGVLLCLAGVLWPKKKAVAIPSREGAVEAALQAALRD